MKVGITAWGNVVSPVFDAARSLLVIEVNGDTVVSRERLPMAGGSPEQQLQKLQTLRENGIDALICGAVSEIPANMIENSGIRLIPFISGPIDAVLQAFLQKQLPTADFLMPGCGLRHRKRRRGRHR